MADLFFADLVREISVATGAGPLALGGASPGHRSFGDVVPTGARFHYAVAGVTHPGQWETGEGELDAGGTLVRSPIASSANGGAVDFLPGSKTVSLTVGAAWFSEQGDLQIGIEDVDGLGAALNGKAALAGAAFSGPVSAPGLSLAAALALGHGGTGAATAAGARANLGLGSAALEAINAFVAAAEKGAAGGVATLDGGGKLPHAQLPAIALTDVNVVASEAAMLALAAQEGDVAIRSDLARSFVNNGGASGTAADWSELLSPSGGVSSVNGQGGAVTLTAANIGSSATGDVASTTVQGAIAELASEKAALVGAAFSGNVTTSGQAAVGGATISGSYRLSVNAQDFGLTIAAPTAAFATPAINLTRGSISCSITPSASGFEIGTESSTDIIFKRGSSTRLRVQSAGISVTGNADVSVEYRIAGTKVVGARAAGWAAASGTAARTTFDTGTATTAQLAERLKALIDDLLAHGLIGA